MATSRTQLRRDLSRLLREPFAQTIPDGYATASAGTATTLVSSTLSHVWEDDAFTRHYLYNVASSEERLIVNFTGSSCTFTVAPAWGTNPSSGDEFEVHSRTTATTKHDAINSAIRAGWPYFYTQDTRLVVVPEEVQELTATENLPSDWYELLNAFYEPPRGLNGPYTADGYSSTGGNTTLTVSTESWTANEFAGYEVAVIAGAGLGQAATVTSNTATQITFPDPATALANGVKFYVKPNDAFGAWRRVTDVLPEGHPLVQRVYLPTWLQAIPGITVRLEGLKRPVELTTDAATTDLPLDYLRAAASAELASRMGLDDGSLNDDAARFVARWDVTAARDLARQLAWPAPSGTKFRDPRGYSDVRDPADPIDWRSVL